ncbi:MAG: VanZ family protein [Candidatus Sumerlaeota bacterium]
MTAIAAPLISLVAIAALIYWLGGGSFGRASTQAWIDRARRHPAIHAWLERHHGQARAAGHYVEFGGLFLVLYWLWDAALGPRTFQFHIIPAVVIAPVCALAAHLDELHQLRSGGRQYRREDFFHSCKGIILAAGIVLLQDVVRQWCG